MASSSFSTRQKHLVPALAYCAGGGGHHEDFTVQQLETGIHCSISLGKSAAMKPPGGGVGSRTICPWIGRSGGSASTVVMSPGYIRARGRTGRELAL